MLNWSGRILGNILYAPENPTLCKPIGLTLSVMTWQAHMTCFQDTNADSVVRVVSTLHSQQLLFLLAPLEETWMFRVRYFWKFQIQISESKNGFWVFLGKSKNGSWIHKIHSQGGFFGSNTNPDFRDSDLSVFLGKDLKKVFLTSGFSKK